MRNFFSMCVEPELFSNHAAFMKFAGLRFKFVYKKIQTNKINGSRIQALKQNVLYHRLSYERLIGEYNCVLIPGLQFSLKENVLKLQKCHKKCSLIKFFLWRINITLTSFCCKTNHVFLVVKLLKLFIFVAQLLNKNFFPYSLINSSLMTAY